MVAMGDADAMVTGSDAGTTTTALRYVRRTSSIRRRWRTGAMGPDPSSQPAAGPCSSPIRRSTSCPTPSRWPILPFRRRRRRGGSATSHGWRWCSFSLLRQPRTSRSSRRPSAMRSAILDSRHVDFEYDGEMGCRRRPQFKDVIGALSLLPPVGAGQCADHAGPAFGPCLDQTGQRAGRRRRDRAVSPRPVQAGAKHSQGATVSEMVNMAALGAHDAIG